MKNNPIDSLLCFNVGGTAWTPTGPAVAENVCTIIACRIELTNILNFHVKIKKSVHLKRSKHPELTPDFHRNHEHEGNARQSSAQTGLEHRFPGHCSSLESFILENFFWTSRTYWSESAFYLRCESLPIRFMAGFWVFYNPFHHERGIRFNKGLVESSWKWFWIQPFNTLKRHFNFLSMMWDEIISSNYQLYKNDYLPSNMFHIRHKIDRIQYLQWLSTHVL